MPVVASRDCQGHEECHDIECDEMATFPLLRNIGHNAAVMRISVSEQQLGLWWAIVDVIIGSDGGYSQVS